jgi:hypothetical protein
MRIDIAPHVQIKITIMFVTISSLEVECEGSAAGSCGPAAGTGCEATRCLGHPEQGSERLVHRRGASKGLGHVGLEDNDVCAFLQEATIVLASDGRRVIEVTGQGT